MSFLPLSMDPHFFGDHQENSGHFHIRPGTDRFPAQSMCPQGPPSLKRPPQPVLFHDSSRYRKSTFPRDTFSLARLLADYRLALAVTTFFRTSAPKSSPAADTMIRVFTTLTSVVMTAATEPALPALIVVISAVSIKEHVAVPFCYR
jgi:hypothetical protein